MMQKKVFLVIPGRSDRERHSGAHVRRDQWYRVDVLGCGTGTIVALGLVVLFSVRKFDIGRLILPTREDYSTSGAASSFVSLIVLCIVLLPI